MLKTNNTSKQANNNRNLIIILAVALAVVAILVLKLADKKDPAFQSGTNVVRAETVKDSDLIIPIGDITDQASFYPVEIDGTKLEVLAVKAPDGTIRTAFNTCQVCYSSGRGYYEQDGNVLVCQNCKNRFNMSEVEVTKGGCNPVPITDENKIVDDTQITIPKEFLTKAEGIFANWKL